MRFLDQIFLLVLPCGGQLHNIQSRARDVCHVTFSSRGGAGSVAKQLHDGQLRNGVSSRLLTMTDSNIKSLLIRNPLLSASALFDYFVVRTSLDSHLFSLFRDGEDKKVLDSVYLKADIVHLHWTPGVLSFETIGLLASSGRGSVWTLHDMWPITGGCHHAGECQGFKTGCGDCPQVRRAFSGKVKTNFQEKFRSFGGDSLISLVAPSKWLAGQVEESAMFDNRKIHVIPNPVDCDIFSPGDLNSARNLFGISNDVFVIGCSAADLNDPMKNMRAIISGVEDLKRLNPSQKFEILAVGEGELGSQRVKVHTTGLINSASRMAVAYRAMDVFVSMSLGENFPMTLVEATSVGVPIICLNSGGMPEAVTSGVTGIILKSHHQLSNSLAQILMDRDVQTKMSSEARKNALKKFELTKIVKKYSEVYEQQLGGQVNP